MKRQFWIAINGASCALSSLAMEIPCSRPRPEVYVGFDTLAEAENAQRICLNEPIEKVEYWMTKWGNQKRIRTVNNPESVSPGEPTQWFPNGKGEYAKTNLHVGDGELVYTERARAAFSDDDLNLLIDRTKEAYEEGKRIWPKTKEWLSHYCTLRGEIAILASGNRLAIMFKDEMPDSIRNNFTSIG